MTPERSRDKELPGRKDKGYDNFEVRGGNNDKGGV